MNWNPDRPVDELPDPLREKFRKEAEFLYHDLESNRLSVLLVPAPDPRHERHMIRAAYQHNPDWYRQLYWGIDNFRRDRSLKALDRIAKGKDKPFNSQPYKYDAIYRELILERVKKYLEEEKHIPFGDQQDIRFLGV